MMTTINSGIIAFTAGEINSAILSLLQNDGKKWLEMRHNCFHKGNPRAALNLANLVA